MNPLHGKRGKNAGPIQDPFDPRVVKRAKEMIEEDGHQWTRRLPTMQMTYLCKAYRELTGRYPDRGYVYAASEERRALALSD